MTLASAIQTASVIGKLNSRWKPHATQKLVLQKVFRDKAALVVVECGRKYGKALALDTPIPTPFGWKAMGDLIDGDILFSETGDQCRVLKAHDVLYGRRVFQVSFSDGSKILACEDHRWFTETKAVRKSKSRAKRHQLGSVVSTVEIKDSLTCGSEWNHSIPNTQPLKIPESVLPIDPYLLGVWLGDGSKRGPIITTPDQEIRDAFRNAGYEIGVNDLTCYVRLPFAHQLRDCGLVENKHVPYPYLRGSAEQRLALLQGLMDTDGTVGQNGHVCFDNTNEDLANAVSELAVSLGMKTRRKSRIGKLYGVEHKLCYRVMFKPCMPVFRLARQLAKCSPHKKPMHRFIVGVEEVPSQPVRCITVDSPSSLYLAGKSMIPTHNTELILAKQHRVIGLRGGVGYYLVPEQKQGREILWRPRRAQGFCPELHLKRPNESDMSLTLMGGGNIKIDGSDNIDQLRGVEPEDCNYDEFKDFRVGFHNAMSPNFAVKKTQLMVCGTPPEAPEGDETAADYDALKAQAIAEGAYFNFPTWANPYIDRDWLRKERALLYARGEGDVWEREYAARRVIGGKRAIFPMFNPARHRKPYDEIMALLRRDAKKLVWQIIADPGTTTCFAVLFRAVNPYTKCVYALSCIYEKDQMETSTSRIVPRIEAMKEEILPNFRARGIEWMQIYDEAAAWFATEAMASFPSLDPWTPTHKGEGGDAEAKKKKGLSLMKDQMLTDRFIVTDRCADFEKEIVGYIKDKNGKIPKKNDHLIDNFRYGNSAESLDLAIEFEPEPKDPDDLRRGYRIEQDIERDAADEFDVDFTEEF